MPLLLRLRAAAPPPPALSVSEEHQLTEAVRTLGEVGEVGELGAIKRALSSGWPELEEQALRRISPEISEGRGSEGGAVPPPPPSPDAVLLEILISRGTLPRLAHGASAGTLASPWSEVHLVIRRGGPSHSARWI